MFMLVVVAPDLKATSRDRKGGSVPAKAIDWAINQCDRYVGAKNHEDIDSRVSEERVHLLE